MGSAQINPGFTGRRANGGSRAEAGSGCGKWQGYSGRCRRGHGAPQAGARPECTTHAGACAESNEQHLNMLRSSVEEACSTKLSFILSASCFLQCDQTSVKRVALHASEH